MTEPKKQRIIVEFKGDERLAPFIMKKINDAILTFESLTGLKIYKEGFKIKHEG